MVPLLATEGFWDALLSPFPATVKQLEPSVLHSIMVEPVPDRIRPGCGCAAVGSADRTIATYEARIGVRIGISSRSSTSSVRISFQSRRQFAVETVTRT